MRAHRKLVNGTGMPGPRHFRRLAMLAVLLGLGFAGVGWRLVDLQVLQHGELRDKSDGARQRVQVQLPERGRILDRQRTVLAGSYFVKTVVGNPSLVGTNAALLAAHIAPVLGMEPEAVTPLLQRRRVTPDGVSVLAHYVVLRRQVPYEMWHRLRQVLRELPLGETDPTVSKAERNRRLLMKRRLANAITGEAVDDQVRYYPGGTLAAHVLGFGRVDRERGDNPWREQLVGVDGVERSMDSVLRGVRGWRAEERIARGQQVLVEASETVPPRNGLNVVLTIDATLQRIVETELRSAFERQRPTSISCVMVHPPTGEILALANVPTFDPNRPGAVSEEGWRRNRAIADVHEPGSTFKVVPVAVALDAGLVRLEDRFFCENGAYRFRGATLTDVHHYSELSVESIVAKSSNIGAAKVAQRMGEGLLYDSMRRFGLGQPTGIPLPGERAGTVHPTNRWSRISVAWIPMGYEVDATPLQMTMAMSAVANRGWLMRPQLILRLEDDEGRVVEQFGPRARGQAVGEAAARQMVAALKTAVHSGTGVRGRLEEYSVAGKTGTAQKLVNGVHVNDRHFASFIGFFPADAPRVCIGVFMDEPRVGLYGGETAAPVFQAIALQAAAYLGVPPEEPPADSPYRTPAVAQAELSGSTVASVPRNGG